MVQNYDLQYLVLIDVSLMNDVMEAHPNRRAQLSNSKQATLSNSLAPVPCSVRVPEKKNSEKTHQYHQIHRKREKKKWLAQ